MKPLPTPEQFRAMRLRSVKRLAARLDALGDHGDEYQKLKREIDGATPQLRIVREKEPAPVPFKRYAPWLPRRIE